MEECQQTIKLLGDEAENQGECRSYVHGISQVKEGEWRMGFTWALQKGFGREVHSRGVRDELAVLAWLV